MKKLYYLEKLKIIENGVNILKRAYELSCTDFEPCDFIKNEKECNALIKERKYNKKNPCPECRMDFYKTQAKKELYNELKDEVIE